ncbi:glycosyltransferase family 1 protein [Candidatus Galacturonibacter soehngenii]|nr:glycosyltransferase family 1 protein [Candidatus Galacturonibacter soehngenii]
MRVLHVTEVLEPAGIESFIMNMYRHINKEKVQFDFFVTRNQKEFYDDEITSLGGKKYCVDCTDVKNVILRIYKEARMLENFLKSNKYTIVHIHTTTPLRVLYLIAAKNAGVKTRIIHSHSAEINDKPLFKKCTYWLFKQLIPLYATHCFGCSKAASRWLFPTYIWKKYKDIIFYNGIDTDVFSFSNSVREKYRNELKLGSEYTIIHVGRFLEQKNQKFLVHVFAELLKRENNSRLLLLGKGPLRREVEEEASALGIRDKVDFLGIRDDVQNVLQAADCYVMPSLYEGLPVSAIEAQSCGLPCVFSTNITNEVQLCERVSFLSLKASITEWVEAILKHKESNRINNASEIVKKCGYNIQDCANALQQIYENSRERIG